MSLKLEEQTKLYEMSFNFTQSMRFVQSVLTYLTPSPFIHRFVKEVGFARVGVHCTGCKDSLMIGGWW